MRGCISRRAASAVVVLLLLIAGSGIHGRARQSEGGMTDWPASRGGSSVGYSTDRIGVQPGPGPEGTLRVKQGYSGFCEAVAGNMLYVTDGGSTLNAFVISSESNTPRWHFQAKDDIILISVAVSGGIVYVGGDGNGSAGSGTLFALDAETGTEMWRRSVPGGGAEIYPVVSDGRVLAKGRTSDGSPTLFALDAVSGSEVWRFAAGSSNSGMTAPTVHGNAVYLGGSHEGAGWILAIDVASGQERWRYVATDLKSVRSPSASGDRIFAGTSVFPDPDGDVPGPALIALDSATGQEAWRWTPTEEGLDFISSPSISGDALFAGLGTLSEGGPTGVGGIVALDPDTGAVRWRSTIRASANALYQPVVSGTVLYTGELSSSLQARVVALDAETGQEQWSYIFERDYLASLVCAVVDGHLYANTYDANEDASYTHAIVGDAGPFAVALPTSTPVPSPTPIPIAPGQSAEVTADGTPLHGAPSTSSIIVVTLSAGTRVDVIGPSEVADGITWWQVVVTDTGTRGWIDEAALSAAQP